MTDEEPIEKLVNWGEDAFEELFQKIVLVLGGLLLAGGLGLTNAHLEPALGVSTSITSAEMFAAVFFIGLGTGRYWGKILSLRAEQTDFFYGGIYSMLFYFGWIHAADLILIPASFTAGIIAIHMSHAVEDGLRNYGILFEKSSKFGLVLLGLWIYVYPVLAEYFPFITRFVPAF